jgi:hypothetical protein
VKVFSAHPHIHPPVNYIWQFFFILLIAVSNSKHSFYTHPPTFLLDNFSFPILFTNIVIYFFCKQTIFLNNFGFPLTFHDPKNNFKFYNNFKVNVEISQLQNNNKSQSNLVTGLNPSCFTFILFFTTPKYEKSHSKLCYCTTSVQLRLLAKQWKETKAGH